ncbi:hypothetical protein TrRE_jg853, partial [Triparma retinervis]
MEEGGIVVVDFNGAKEGGFDVVEKAVGLGLVDVVHVNEEEMRLMWGEERWWEGGAKGAEGTDAAKKADGAAQADYSAADNAEAQKRAASVDSGVSETLSLARRVVSEFNIAVLAVTRGAKECVVVCGSK